MGACIGFSCQNQSDPFEANKVPSIQGKQQPSTYSPAEFEELLADQGSTEGLLAKTELFAYGFVRLFTEEGGFSNNVDFLNSIPCDLAISDSELFLRLYVPKLGISETRGEEALGKFLGELIVGNTYTAAEIKVLYPRLCQSFKIQGNQYHLYSQYEKGRVPDGSKEIFIGFNSHWDGTEYLIEGYHSNLVTGEVNRRNIDLQESSRLGMIWLESWSNGSEYDRFNDPCYYVFNGGGSNSGNNGGSNDLDDDGTMKNGFSGGVIGSLSSPLGTACPAGPTGLRITEMHLADRMEGGLFGGKSEVYVNVTAFSNYQPIDNHLHNSGSGQFDNPRFQLPSGAFGQPLAVRRGKQLASVSPASISSSSNIVLTENTPAKPDPNDDWILIDEGFCSGTEQYNNAFILIYERDGYITGDYYEGIEPSLALLTNPSLPDTARSVYQSHHDYEKYVDLTLSPNELSNNNNELYIGRDSNGSFFKSSSQPTADNSWFKLELF